MATIQLTLIQARNDLWSRLGKLQCNWTTSTDVDAYIEKAARERGIALPTSSTTEIRVVPILAEINALEFLYNNAMNHVDVTMGGKTVELSQIADHLLAKLKLLRQDLLDALEDTTLFGQPLGTRRSVTYVPSAEKQKVDVRQTERYEG